MSPADPSATNTLGAATSPYLRQHAENPVHWQQWTPQALADAAARDVPTTTSAMRVPAKYTIIDGAAICNLTLTTNTNVTTLPAPTDNQTNVTPPALPQVAQPVQQYQGSSVADLAPGELRAVRAAEATHAQVSHGATS